MKKLLFVFCLTILSESILFSQQLETIGAGVAEFLLSSPTSANKMNADQQIALRIIGNLLNTAGQRKHDINLAQAGKTEMTLNTNTGQQLQLVMDSNGNVYVMNNSIIYPISQNIVTQAKDYVLNQQPGYMDYVKDNTSFNNFGLMLPDYNYNQLENAWDKAKTYKFRDVIINENKYISEIMEDLQVKIEDLYINYYGGENGYRNITKVGGEFNQYITNNKQIYVIRNRASLSWKNHNLPLYAHVINNYVKGTFSFKWFKDINSDGNIAFNEIQDIRRNFFPNESFAIIAGFYYQRKYLIKVDIYDQLTGSQTFTESIEVPSEIIDAGYFTVPANYLKPGMYVYYISFIDLKTKEILENLSEKFQILSIEQTKVKEKETNLQPKDTLPYATSSKTKMINELIQLLKEGKISEETFNNSMKIIEKKDN